MNPDLPPFCADKCVGNIFLNVILEFLLGKSKSKFQSTHVAAADILDKELHSFYKFLTRGEEFLTQLVKFLNQTNCRQKKREGP